MRSLMRVVLTCTLIVSLLVAAGSTPAQTADDVRIEDPIIVESRDGTPIVATLMLPGGASRASPAPVVLQTHGWGGTRAKEPGGILNVLLARGYAVLTWDSRGFGESGGEANIGAPGFEVADARALIDYLAARPEILKDSPDDPRLGWIGGSNAAGVQFNTAAVDKRIDALVPEISWGDLVRDLLPGGVLKQTWDLILYGAGGATAATLGIWSPAGPQTGIFAREIHLAFVQGTATGELDADLIEWFSRRSTTRRSHRVDAPTFIIQGSVDTLFPLNDGFENYTNLIRAGTPVKLMTYCAGHTLGCDYPGGASGDPEDSSDARPLYERRTLAWLDRHVRNKRIGTGAAVEWQAQDGFYYAAPSYPLPRTKLRAARPMTDVILVGPGATGGDEPASGGPAPEIELGTTAQRATILGPADRPRAILGNPRLSIRGRTVGVKGHSFFELIDVAPGGTRVTLDDQTMPRALPLGEFKKSFDLHGVSWMLQPGHRLELEITTGSTQYSIPRTGPYRVTFDEAAVKLPLTPWRAHRHRVAPGP
ncbi:MAG: S15 peptidase family protein [Actinomycetota bacterium]